MTTNHIRQLLENANKLLDAYKRTEDAELLDMAGALITLAIEDLDEMAGVPSVTMGPWELVPGTTEYRKIPDGVFAYAVPGVEPYDPPSGQPSWQDTISGTTITPSVFTDSGPFGVAPKKE